MVHPPVYPRRALFPVPGAGVPGPVFQGVALLADALDGVCRVLRAISLLSSSLPSLSREACCEERPFRVDPNPIVISLFNLSLLLN